MAEAKTKPTSLSVESYLSAIVDSARRADCETLVKLMSKTSKQPAVMWGTAIVGFGTHKYPLAGGKFGEICAVGFSSRKGDISIYGVAGEGVDSGLMLQLGKHKLGKGCLYVAKLADVDLKVLEKLVAEAVRAKQVLHNGPLDD
ncbi:DUF1801 domain-containing protein [Ideonella sp.]|uniref:DUF1801 domain-containing protein n=1 Tax=Ideonella sp. TaxID=1929293 RepID=UPI003BB52043